MVRAADLDADPLRPPDVAARLLAFAVAVAAFHNLPPLAPRGAEEWVDLATPFAVLAAAAWTLAATRPPPRVWALAGGAAVAYAGGHGIHLAANAIRNEGTSGAAEDAAYFWDETWGHLEWHAGLFLLLAALCLAGGRGRALPLGLASLLLGFTIFTNTVEGGDWWLGAAAAAAFVAWALLRRTATTLTVGAAFATFALLLAVWAVWHRGVPQFSELGWL